MGIPPGRLGVSDHLCRSAPLDNNLYFVLPDAPFVFRLLYRSDVKQGQRRTVTEACCTPTASKAARAFREGKGGREKSEDTVPGLRTNVQPTTRPAGTLAPGVAKAGLSEEPWKEFSKKSPPLITERALTFLRLHNIDHLPYPGWGAISENPLPLFGFIILPGRSPADEGRETGEKTCLLFLRSLGIT